MFSAFCVPEALDKSQKPVASARVRAKVV